MSTTTVRKSSAIIVALGLAAAIGCAQHTPVPVTELGYLKVSEGMTLRRMVVHSPEPKGTVLLLHGFPETLYTWTVVSRELASEYEVHAIDWPGYGLSSRPPVEEFSYAPRAYSLVLRRYIEKAAIDTSKLTIYATDIGALPVLLLALDQPRIARVIIVGDFAPFNRPQHMYESLQNLKSEPTSLQIRANMNKNRDEILANAFRRGLPVEAQFAVSRELSEDMARGWSHGGMTTADAFYHYYSHFTRDQEFFEANLAKLRTRVKVLWGEKDIYIRKEMGLEFAAQTGAELILLPGIGHYPHLQDPKHTVGEIQASFQ